MSSQYGELRLRSASEFAAPQQISTSFASWLRYCTNVAQRRSTKLCRLRSLATSWAAALYIHFWGSSPLTEFS